MEFTEQSKVVEWSVSQRAFHVEPLSRTLERNVKAFRRGSGSDYIPIGIFNDDKEMDEFLKDAHGLRKWHKQKRGAGSVRETLSLGLLM